MIVPSFQRTSPLVRRARVLLLADIDAVNGIAGLAVSVRISQTD